MKKYLLAGILTISCIAVTGQVVKAFTLSGGYVSSNQDRRINNRKFNLEPRGGWGIEAGVLFWQSQHLAFTTHTGFIKKGYRMNIPFTTVDQPDQVSGIIEAKTRLNYIYVAPRIAFQYKTKHITPYVFLAPRIDYFVGAAEKWYLNGEYFSEDEGQAGGAVDFYKNNHKPFVFGVTTGAGAETRVHKNIAVGIELAYIQDFTRSVYLTENLPNQAKFEIWQQAAQAQVVFKHYFE